MSDAHGGSDKGAQRGSLIEIAESNKIIDELQPLLKAAGYTFYRLPRGYSLSKTIEYMRVNFLRMRYTVGIEIHKDGGPASANGASVYYYTGDSTARQAGIISAELAKYTGLVDRKAHPDAKTHVGRLGFLRAPGEQLLIEAGFIGNPKDGAISHKQYAQGIFNGIAKAYPLTKETTMAGIPVTREEFANALFAKKLTAIFKGPQLKPNGHITRGEADVLIRRAYDYSGRPSPQVFNDGRFEDTLTRHELPFVLERLI